VSERVRLGALVAHDGVGDHVERLGTSSVLTHFRRSECAFWWRLYDAELAGSSPGGAFID